MEFHALGNATGICVMAAESLQRNEYGIIKSIQTKTVTLDGRDGREAKKAKLLILVDRHPKFFDNMKRFQAIKEENEMLREGKKVGETAEEGKGDAKERKGTTESGGKDFFADFMNEQ